MEHKEQFPDLLLRFLLSFVVTFVVRVLWAAVISLLPAQEALTLDLEPPGPQPQAAQYDACAPSPGVASDTAQIITDTVYGLDMVLVFDESGSMDDGTYCYRDNGGSREPGHPCYIQGESQYPDGERLYVPYAAWIATPLDPPLRYNNHEILVAEAEYFSYSTSFLEHPYDREYYRYPGTFWMVQRVQGSQASGYRYTPDDRRGAHLMHMPHQAGINGHQTASSYSPRLDYNLTIPASAPLPSTWYAWIRAQCGGYEQTADRTDSCVAHWGIDGLWRNGESTDYDDFGHRQSVDYNKNETGSDLNRWVWVRLGSFIQTDRNVQINIWGGGSGFRLDKVVITRDPGAPDSGYPDRAPAFIRATTPAWDSVRYDDYQTYVYDGRYGGPLDTGGRDGMAVMECNPIYGLRVNPSCTPGQAPTVECRDLDGNGRVDLYEICDNRYDDMYDDEQPIRTGKGAAASLIKRLRARHEQVGFVGYHTVADTERMRELNCILVPHPSGGLPMPDYPGVWDPATNQPDPAWIWCYDHRLGSSGYEGDQSADVTWGSLLKAIEDMDAAGFTNLAEGIQLGIGVLSTEEIWHYGRPCATSVMILISDGVPNRWPNYTIDRTCTRADSCCAQDWYPVNDRTSEENRAADCAIYYARQARDSDVIIHTVGLGLGADLDLLSAVAHETGGQFYFAPGAEDLDQVMGAIVEHSRTLAPAMEVSVQAAFPALQPGKPLTYTLAVTNTGTVDLHATITSTLPGHAIPTGTLTWTPAVTTPGGIWTQTVVVTVEPGYTGPLNHLVEVAAQDCLTATRVLSLVRGVEAGQMSTPDPVQPGGVLTYTLAVTNTGNVPLHATITDTLPLHVRPGGMRTWSQVTIPPAEAWTEVLNVTVDLDYVGPLTNTVHVTTEEGVADAHAETAIATGGWWHYLPLVTRMWR